MKMVKKILLGLTATAAVIGFASCGISDDPENAITGSGNNYKVDYENTDTVNYRAYESTDLKHAGALVKVTFDNKDVGKSKMGVIFGLQEDKKTDTKSFCIIGLGTAKENNFYVSKFSKVEDIQAENFGAVKGGPAEEEEVIKIGSRNFTSADFEKIVKTDGSASFYVWFKANIYGDYEYAILAITDEEAKRIDMDEELSVTNDKVIYRNIIEDVFPEVTSGKDKDIPQHQMAVYAMIAPNQHLTGSWKYFDMYKETEEIAE